jgi:uncharacterized protein (TIGR02246 family)
MKTTSSLAICLGPLLLGFAAFDLGACEQSRPAPVITSKIIDAIKADEVHWNVDYRSGDPAKVVSHYAPHATVMMPGGPPLVGTPAIKAAMDQAYQDPHFGVSFASDKVDVAKSGDIAASRGAWRQTSTDPKTKQVTVATGYFVTVYKPQPDGRWLAIWDILTPAPTPDLPGAPPIKPAG